MTKRIKNLTRMIVGKLPIEFKKTFAELILLNNNEFYIAVRPIFEFLGLDWSGQRRKLLRKQSFYNPAFIVSKAKDGRQRKMLCLPFEKFSDLVDKFDQDKVPNVGALDIVKFLKNDHFPQFLDPAVFTKHLKYHAITNLKITGKRKEHHYIRVIDFANLGFFFLYGKPAENIDELLEYAKVRFVQQNENRWYSGKDICKFLMLSQYRTVMGRISTKNKKLIPIDTPGGSQKMICINLEGLKEIIQKARKPKVKYSLQKYLDL